MKHQIFWTYFLIGAIVGFIVGFMKNEFALWLAVGAAIGFMVALILETKTIKHKAEPEKLMWLGFFCLFPIMFFTDFLRPTFWYDVFGILAVVGTFIMVINFFKILKKRRDKNNEKNKRQEK